MIKGSINKYEEHQAYTSSHTPTHPYHWAEQEEHTYYMNRTHRPRLPDPERKQMGNFEISKQLEDILKKGEALGLVRGAIVRRANNYVDQEGSIILIHKDPFLAYNKTENKIEPFRVQWGEHKHGNNSSVPFDYSLDEILVVRKQNENLPVLLKAD